MSRPIEVYRDDLNGGWGWLTVDALPQLDGQLDAPHEANARVVADLVRLAAARAGADPGAIRVCVTEPAGFIRFAPPDCPGCQGTGSIYREGSSDLSSYDPCDVCNP